MDGVRLLTAGARCCLIFPNFENKLFRSNPFSSPSFLYNISGREGKGEGRGRGGEGYRTLCTRSLLAFACRYLRNRSLGTTNETY